MVNVEDNQWVDEGATLVEIDPKDHEVTLARAQATLDTSNSCPTEGSLDTGVFQGIYPGH
jgi:membrane fusion protein (multidrug efflux system)